MGQCKERKNWSPKNSKTNPKGNRENKAAMNKMREEHSNNKHWNKLS